MKPIKRKPKMAAGLRLALEKSMGKVGFALHQLMARPKVPRGKKALRLEETLSINFADELRKLTKEYYETGGKSGLRAVWCHCANERTASLFTHTLLRAMGMLPGAPDYWFVWDNGSALIELKVEADLSGNQDYFQSWADAFHINHAICRNVPDALTALYNWGAIKGIPPEQRPHARNRDVPVPLVNGMPDAVRVG